MTDAAPDPDSALPGVDLAALSRWLDSEQPGLRTGALSGAVIAGGKSNLTYRITDGRNIWALRRPPLAHVLPTAHDMAREYRVISALAPTPVPVPQPIALCAEEDVLGAPFYLMHFVDGVVLDRGDVLERLDTDMAGQCCAELVDTLGSLHAVDPDEVGLGDFGRPDGFLGRQVRRWHTQWQASQSEPREHLDEVVRLLGTALPPQSRPGIVHGDYRLTNVMFTPELSAIAAVVDWEMATLGDPLTDLGLLVVYQGLARENDMVVPRMRPEAGFWTPEQMVQRYAEGSDRDLTHLPWYVAFGCFKLAVIAEGIHYRFLQGKTVGAGFDQVGRAVPLLLERALTLLTAS